ncbi:sensor histidine kinase [Chloroflexota bacterium]
MRWQLFLAFAVVVLVSVFSLGYWIQQNALQVIDTFAQRGGFIGADPFVNDLENYYAEHQTWDGAEEILTRGNLPEMMQPTHQAQSPEEGQGQGQGQAQGQGQGQGVGMGQGQGVGMGPRSGMMGKNAPPLSLVDADGAVLVGGEFLDNLEHLTPEQLQNALPLRYQGEIVGYLVPYGSVYANQVDIQTALGAQMADAALNAMLLAGGLSLVLAILLGYLILNPVRKLTEAASHMAQGDLSQRVAISGSSELVTLGETFNSMAESLEEAEQHRQALTADIAHELRTPLAVQRANLEAMQDGIYPLDQENLERVLEQNSMLAQLVEDLRTLALSDANELELNTEPTDVISLVKHVGDQFKRQAEREGITLTVERLSSPPNLNLDPRRVSQILNNLISNALRYTPSGSEVKLEIETAAEVVLVRVRDNGPGIPPEALPHIFERFYRADPSRARHEGGTGLGLTIARRLAQAHGGELTAANQPDGGAVLTLSLPKK